MASLPKSRKLKALSAPALVALIRKLMKEQVAWRLTHNGEDPPTGPLFRAAMDEAKRRNIEINHPELQ